MTQLTDEQIIAIRDQHLPSQGEAFNCIAFARAVEAVMFDDFQEELDKKFQTIKRMARLLTETAVSLKGLPDELTMHDWSDLPQLAQKMIDSRTELRRVLQMVGSGDEMLPALIARALST